ncbi:rRNA adenine N-6-methyltransferase family protein [Streptosporangium sp. NPDC048047]|uniref:rRNA adenine N-6-methyltransferase family protein n=1 Tax=Streptosporangium sp. NPDC048047 TaxID=3155748 RepID=UPI00342F40EF
MTDHGTSDLAVRLRRMLADKLVRGGCLTDPAWRAAVEAVPREVFLGAAIAGPTGHGDRWEVVRRDDVMADEWLELVYRDETWVTQLDETMVESAPRAGGAAMAKDGPEGEAVPETEGASETRGSREVVSGRPTSSSTMPNLVVRMLEAAQISDGDTVLEIGTGTGYSTALMCHRLGPAAVTSVEYDPVVAGRAREALAAVGYAPTLVTGDGLAGYDGNAEYDRLIATCSIRYVPLPWLWQVRDGGTITAPLSGWLGGGAFAHLTLADDGTACGRFLPDDLHFMTARPHGRPPVASPHLGMGEVRDGRVDPRVLDDRTGVFVAQLAVPSAVRLGGGDEVVLWDVGTGSLAEVTSGTVRQRGPLRLWDAVEDAVLTWRAAGTPDQTAFGLTVTPARQYVWLGEPDGPNWDLPA